MISTLTVCSNASGSSSVGVRSPDHRVHCEFREFVDIGQPAFNVECTSAAATRYINADQSPLVSPCLAGGEDSPELHGPGTVAITVWNRHFFLDQGCYLGAHHFQTLSIGHGVVERHLGCAAIWSDELLCRSHESGRGFAISSQHLRLF